MKQYTFKTISSQKVQEVAKSFTHCPLGVLWERSISGVAKGGQLPTLREILPTLTVTLLPTLLSTVVIGQFEVVLTFLKYFPFVLKLLDEMIEEPNSDL